MSKRERQARNLASRRGEMLRQEWRAVKLWVAYFDQRLMGGWQAFIESRDGRTWVDRDAKFLIPRLMELFPVSLFPGWREWAPAFAEQFRRRVQDRRPVGVAYLWQKGWLLSRRAEGH